jgi:hypothetical protein
MGPHRFEGAGLRTYSSKDLRNKQSNVSSFEHKDETTGMIFMHQRCSAIHTNGSGGSEITDQFGWWERLFEAKQLHKYREYLGAAAAAVAAIS